MTSVTSVSGTERMTIATKTLTIVTALFTNCGMDWEIIWRSVSTSFV